MSHNPMVDHTLAAQGSRTAAEPWSDRAAPVTPVITLPVPASTALISKLISNRKGQGEA